MIDNLALLADIKFFSWNFFIKYVNELSTLVFFVVLFSRFILLFSGVWFRVQHCCYRKEGKKLFSALCLIRFSKNVGDCELIYRLGR
ncbi:unnamed protein product [Trifolium pratense]|uniref:Uncharacterized protein n=1 Tax=Trifolium pratense TaxID=57577 RepID=A0ACB0IMQ9_TRIPR|nr:unnamed protein product [Trifolium pratense]